ncbi:MAG: right-handed parallel beta-helix repeat-containing protein [Candidatus Yanofskybacteria bacterium]|nr:right-handed parallel beta-helix repeat-containing protein [Candidatus Yanofskybacteria bacterium]
MSNKKIKPVFILIVFIGILFFSAGSAQASFLSGATGFFGKVIKEFQKVTIDLSLIFAKNNESSNCVPESFCKKIVRQGFTSYCAQPLGSICQSPAATPIPSFTTTSFISPATTTSLPVASTTVAPTSSTTTTVVATTTSLPADSGRVLQCIPQSFCRQSLWGYCLFPIGSLCPNQTSTTTTTTTFVATITQLPVTTTTLLIAPTTTLPPTTTTTQAPATTTTLSPTTTTTLPSIPIILVGRVTDTNSNPVNGVQIYDNNRTIGSAAKSTLASIFDPVFGLFKFIQLKFNLGRAEGSNLKIGETNGNGEVVFTGEFINFLRNNTGGDITVSNGNRTITIQGQNGLPPTIPAIVARYEKDSLEQVKTITVSSSGTMDFSIKLDVGSVTTTLPSTTTTITFPPTTTPTVFIPPQTTTITIRARGTRSAGQYPIMQLWQGSNILGTWTVKEDRADYTYTSQTALAAQNLQVVFTNDLWSNGEDRNLTVDSITVNGTVYLSNSPTVYVSDCNTGYLQTTTLYCDDSFFEYPTFGAAPSPSVPLLSLQLLFTHPEAAAQPTADGRIIGTLHDFDGKIFSGYGDYGANTGPIAIRSYNPLTKNSRVEYVMRTEQIARYMNVGDRLYAVAIDPGGGGNSVTIGGDVEYAYRKLGGSAWVGGNNTTSRFAHVFDIASLDGQGIWLFGSVDPDDGAAIHSPDGGKTWDPKENSANLYLPGTVESQGWNRLYFGGTLNGKLYTQSGFYSKSRVFDPVTKVWTEGPNLLPSYGSSDSSGSRPLEFAGKMVYITAYNKMLAFDGSHVSEPLLPFSRRYDTVTDFQNYNGYLYVLAVGNGGYALLRTADLSNWEAVGAITTVTSPNKPSSFRILDGIIYVGMSNARILSVSMPTTFISLTTTTTTLPSNLTYYVSPSGNDANAGTSGSAPFRTIEKARDVVRANNTNMAQDITVYLRGGTYELSQTLVFNQNDSGTNGRNIIYKNYPGEKPVVSGGRVVTGWVQDGDKWRASIGAGLQARQLYVNGIRATRARSEGALPGGAKTSTGFTTSDMSMQNWGNIQDIELVSKAQWKLFRCGVQSILGGSMRVKQLCWDNAQSHTGYTMDEVSWIENAYELLDQPGEWYLNRATGWLYYKPRAGENITSAQVVLPVLETLVAGQGTLDQPLRNLRFEGITFSYAGWARPNDANGFAEVQANFHLVGVGGINVTPLTKISANVDFKNANSIVFERNIFNHLGAGGLNFGSGSQNNVISGNQFYDISGSGLMLGEISDPQTTDQRIIVKNNRITNNYIYDVAAEYWGGVGLWVGYTQNTTVAHNELHDLPYTAVSIGWGWGGSDPSVARDNKIQQNLIYDHVNVLTDGGGVYSLSAQPGNVYSGNFIHGQPNDSAAMYLDNRSRGITVDGNVLFDNKRSAIFKGGAQGGEHTIRNNYWQNRYDTDVYFYYNPGEGAYAGGEPGPNTIQNNHEITDLSQVPATIINSAGLESAYADIRSSPSPASQPNVSTNITVRARGTSAAGQYPIMELRQGSTALQRWTVTGGYRDYTYTSGNNIGLTNLSVHFLNDYFDGIQDRNLIVDYISVNGRVYQSEDAYEQGYWSPTTGCASGRFGSETIYCQNGYFEYSTVQSGFLNGGMLGQILKPFWGYLKLGDE